MAWSSTYLTLGILSVFCVFTALVKARRLYFFAPVYFFSAWLCGELAIIHLLWQLGLTLLVGLKGGLDSSNGQLGLVLFGLSWLGLLYLHAQSLQSGPVLKRALRTALGNNYGSELPADRQWVLRWEIDTGAWLRPFSMRRDGVRVHRDIAYAEGDKRNLLDVYQPTETREGGFPVLLQVHGGGWMIGNKQQQGVPLMYHLAQRGWLCVACNYRLSPKDAFPAHVIDVKRSIAWIREHAREFGGNPDFIAITGGSAGGHLSSLAALTPNRIEWQPGFEGIDTSVDAAVPIYGVFDLLDREDIRGDMSMEKFLAKYVMKESSLQNRQLWEDASPISHVSGNAPPVLVIHGTHDSLAWVEEARCFVANLQKTSEQVVAYAELPGAQHAFDVFHSVRTEHVVNGVSDFLEWCYARREHTGPGSICSKFHGYSCD
jgi:acetyl esterase/lipase